MIPVAKVKKPQRFDAEVQTPGNQWLKANPHAKRPKSLWVPFTKDLSDGFANLCGYAAMHDPTGGTVDHYLSFKNHPDKAYVWDNYRFASGTLNSSKRTLDELHASAARHRSPLVLQCIQDYLAGQRAPLALIHTDASVLQATAAL